MRSPFFFIYRYFGSTTHYATITTTPTTPPLQQRQPRHHYNNHQTTPPQQPPRSDSAHGCQRPGLRRGKAGGPRSPLPRTNGAAAVDFTLRGKRKNATAVRVSPIGRKPLPSGSCHHVLEGGAGVERGRGFAEKGAERERKGRGVVKKRTSLISKRDGMSVCVCVCAI